MGLSLKKLGNLAATAAGAYFGGPAGAVGADAVMGAVGLGSDDLAAEEQWKWSKKAADYKYQQDLNMWNLVNAYNDPSAQMERLQKAGLNPNLVYGGGNVTGNTSGSGPEYSGINAGYTDRSIQRQQLAMAMKDHQQRITNQAIQNDLARQELALRLRASEREDEKLSLLKNRMANLTLSSGDDIVDVNDEIKQLRKKKLEQDLEQPFNSSWAKDLYKNASGVTEKIIGGLLDADRQFRKANRQYEKHITGRGKGYVTYGRRVR